MKIVGIHRKYKGKLPTYTTENRDRSSTTVLTEQRPRNKTTHTEDKTIHTKD